MVAATLNSLSPWADRRTAKTRKGQRHILENAYYRSGKELLSFSAYPGTAKSVVYFDKNDEIAKAVKAETRGREQNLETGAFLAVKWEKLK